MSDLRDLYQEVILDHGKNPRNYGKPDSPCRRADGHNPLCGDRLTVYLVVEDDVVRDVRFEGTGCAISTASASMMSEALRGKTRAEIEAAFERFHSMVTEGHDEGAVVDMGKLAVFEGVKEFPVRVKCATLAWHTLRAALANRTETVTTE